MFERFTEGARRVVTGAQEQARALGTPFIGTEHLLLSLLDGDDATARVLTEHGVEASAIGRRIARKGEDPLDPEALSTLGIDLDAVREATEEVFGEGALDVPAGRRRRFPKGHIPFTPRAKKALELSLRHAIRLKQKQIRSGHVLLGVLHDKEFMSVRILSEAGVDVAALRAHVERLLSAEAA
ncbi:Clp protease N-terminal domain-containing protein [Actinomadura madurae]|uniref:Clp amino terminal domain-containing protein, pathogenicity island component n=1 Tax=Actinomadura madurae TaxID=1993 RepID=A0A1I4XP52_9ACTN|nr:Clp protease N-terminal domain-containing protein [Actinomadura madurae]SFN27183.1 Clp amino terminal domain-containing protein, pathogenicity island component [Actinomadura madurae]SPT63558.1 Probable ATP-dependent Clp protease ATP-binding subunit [Actinomadura madurae]